MKKALLAILVALPAGAFAFFDGFDGSDLGTHWSRYTETATNWTYTVSDSVFALHSLNSQTPFSEVSIVTLAGGYSDFVAEARVMWDGSTHQTLTFGLKEHFQLVPRIGTIRYRIEPGTEARVAATVNAGGSGSILAPVANEWHVFRIAREGSTIQAFVDGTLLASTNTGVIVPAKDVFLHFGGPDSEAFGDLKVDYVSVVPEPGTIAAFAAGVAMLLRKRSSRVAVVQAL